MEDGVKRDKYVQAVKEKFEQRSQTGIKKYNTTLEREDLNLIQWINHAQEEAMDLTLYLERIKAELKNTKLDGEKVTEESRRGLEQQYPDKLEEK